MIAKAVHILKEGRALCGLPGLPKDWPEGHVWISIDDAKEGQATCPQCLTVRVFRETPAGDPCFTYSSEEREQMLAMMRDTSNAFYNRARLIGCHPFIEFADLMNEYIKVCQRAHDAGIDFTESSAHSGKPLDFRTYEAAYLGEKLGCIYGPSLLAGEGDEGGNLRAFLRALGAPVEDWSKWW